MDEIESAEFERQLTDKPDLHEETELTRQIIAAIRNEREQATLINSSCHPALPDIHFRNGVRKLITYINMLFIPAKQRVAGAHSNRNSRFNFS